MKKQLSLAMAGVMALSLAACGGSSASSAATSTAEAASSAAESTAESTAAEGDVLRPGCCRCLRSGCYLDHVGR